VVKDCVNAGCNQLEVMCFSALNTGETFGTPLYNHYFKVAEYRNLYMNARFEKGFLITRDHIDLAERKIYQPNGVMVNYGGCKPAAEQEEKLKRREKAWREGLANNIGKHFRVGKSIGWIYKSDNDIRNTKYWEYVKKWL
jgi:hypothetical protein